jgi:hypothetical protein
MARRNSGGNSSLEGTHAQVDEAGADVSRMTAPHTTLLGAKAPIRNQQAPVPDEAHWRAAAQEAVRRAAKHWQVPLDNITEIALSDADGPSYLFKVLYTDVDGNRFTAAVHVPKDMAFISPLSMSALMPGSQ